MSIESVMDELYADIRCDICGKKKEAKALCRNCTADMRHERHRGQVDEFLARAMPSEAELNSSDPLVKAEARRTRRMLLASAGQAMSRQMIRDGVRDRGGRRGGSIADEYQTDYRRTNGRTKSNGRNDLEAAWRRPQTKWTPRADLEPV